MIRTLSLLVAAICAASTLHAQVLVGTAPASGSSASPEIYHVDLATQVVTGPLWTGTSAMGLAADDVGRVVYTSTVGAGNLGYLSAWPYGDPNPPVMIGTIMDTVSMSPLRLEGLAWANGALHAVQLSSTATGAPQGIYRIDLATQTAVPVYVFPNTSINVSGLGFDPTTGRFYCPNDGLSYPGGLGIVEVDVVAQTETTIAPYPTGRNDIDGCAVDPAGRVILVEDEPSMLHMYDLGTSSYVPMPPANPITTAQIHSGGAWAPSLLGPGGLGASYCGPAVPNSTGSPGVLLATGSSAVIDNQVTIRAASLPNGSFGYFLTSPTQGNLANPGGSQGVLCLAGGIGRYVGPGQIRNTGTTGSFEIALNLAQTPTPGGLVPIQPGETWNFQAWYRDANPGVTSNFTDGRSIVFR